MYKHIGVNAEDLGIPFSLLDSIPFTPYNIEEIYAQLEVIPMYRYKTSGTCSQEILIDIEGNIIKKVEFVGGCRGNTQGVAALVKGMKVEEVIARCEGIECRGTTSCPDQLAQALKSIL